MSTNGINTNRSRLSNTNNQQQQETPQATTGESYKIKTGDTLSGIAKSLGIPMDQLLAANPQITNPDVIRAGASLNLPQAAPAAEPTRPGTPGQADGFEKTRGAPVDVRAQGTPATVTADPNAQAQLNTQLQQARITGNTGRPATGEGAPHADGGAHGGIHWHDKSTFGEGDAAGTDLNAKRDESSGLGLGVRNGDAKTGTAESFNNISGRSKSVSVQRSEYRNYDVTSRTVERNNNGRVTEERDATVNKKDGSRRLVSREEGERQAHTEKVETNATATLYAREVSTGWQSGGPDGKGRSIGTDPNDPTKFKDETGAAGEVHALAYRATGTVAAGVDLKKGQLNVGAQGKLEADLIGASGRAQVGRSDTLAGQGFVKGEAHVGARIAGGAGLEIDPRKGTARVGVGGEAFVGAEIKGAVGYQNKYVGASVEARGQAGAGVSAHAEIGIDKGVFRAKADLGACVGLGGRITVDVNVNVGAMAKDAYQGAKSAWNAVKSWF